MCLRQGAKSSAVTDTDPGGGRVALGVQWACASDQEDVAAQRTASAVNRFVREAHRRLLRHPLNLAREARGLLPVNGVLTRSAGGAAPLGNVVTSLGLNASVISGERTVEGLGRLFGFRTFTRPLIFP